MFMTMKHLDLVGAVPVATIKNGDLLHDVADGVLEEPGFYFLINNDENSLGYGKVSARFFVGRQRSKTGFRNVLSQIRRGRSTLGRIVRSNNVQYLVLRADVKKMKPLTTGFGKGQLSLAFTRKHEDAFQNITEMNNMLGDNFTFTLQAY